MERSEIRDPGFVSLHPGYEAVLLPARLRLAVDTYVRISIASKASKKFSSASCRPGMIVGLVNFHLVRLTARSKFL